MSDHHRPITVAEEAFFSKCGTGKGKEECDCGVCTKLVSVPVIAVFTKCDALHGVAFQMLKEQGKGTVEAVTLAPKHAEVIFKENDYHGMLQRQRFPPRHFVQLQGE